MSVLDKTNESAYKYQESVYNDIAEICRPLSEYLSIKAFGYGKVFFDGRYFFINNQSDLSRNYLQFILQEDVNIFTGRSMRPPDITQQITTIAWPAMTSSPTMQFLYSHGFWSGFSFGRMLPDSMEYWTFLGDKESSNDMYSFCLDNQNTLLKFIQYFNVRAQKIIQCEEGDEYKFGFYKNGYKTLEELQRLHPKDIAINGFLEALRKNSKYLHNIKPELTYLTPREQACLSFLAKGGTAKEIARDLEISPRTVETHLKAIKCKTGFHSRSQLVKFFLNHFS